MKLIQDITEGEEISHQITITFRLYQQFMDLSGDTSPIHSNKNFAQAHGFKDVLGYAFLLTALLSKIYGTIFPGGSELCLQQECNFPKPYYINDTLTFKI
ncbi:MAG: enoyl-CoA hydratase, partial [Candidatus Levybacteria bacterium CG10_big_fil_rev_8_21_14_0_10_36_7]